jgi:hypothetical protein
MHLLLDKDKILPFTIFSLKPTAMFKLCLSLLILTAIACNTQSDKASDTTDSAKNAVAATKSFTWSDEDEKEFLAGCVENAKANLSDTAAYAQCHCVLEQLKKTFPTMDSAANALSDSATAAAYVSKCR